MKQNPFLQDLDCPKCKTEFEVEVSWDNSSGECPSCQTEWFLDEYYDDETGDTHLWVDWEMEEE